jgi:hypothetical protein
MRLAALAVVVLALAFTTDARAGVDWSEYIDKSGSSKLPPSKTPTPGYVDAKPKPAKANKRTAGAKKAKATKAKPKAKPRAKAKKRRR